MDKIKIRISNNAYSDMINLLNFHDEYNCFRLYYENGCCKSSKVQLMLDTTSPTDVCDKIEDLVVCYTRDLIENIYSVTILLEKGNYLIKSESSTSLSSCNNCSKNCKGGCH